MIQTTLIMLIILLIVNAVSLGAFGVDKLQSKRKGSRIAESKLLLLAFFAPFGALAGMALFRHKTHKHKFLLVPLFVLFQAFILIWFFYPTLIPHF